MTGGFRLNDGRLVHSLTLHSKTLYAHPARVIIAAPLKPEAAVGDGSIQSSTIEPSSSMVPLACRGSRLHADRHGLGRALWNAGT
jgi:hypothetical protein